MMLPPPYRPAATAATGFGAAIFRQDDLRLSSGEALKKTNFVGVLSNFAPRRVPPVHSAPSPIVLAGKLYTTSTVLSSGEALKKTNFVGIMSNSSPSLLPLLLPAVPSLFSANRQGSPQAATPRPAYCYFPQRPGASPQPPAASPGSPSPPALTRPAAACRGGCPPRCGAPGRGPGPSRGLSCCSRGGRCSCGRGR